MRRRELLTMTGSGLVAGCTGRMGPDSRFDGEPCPDIDGSPTTCYHSAGLGIDDVILEPKREYLDEPGPNQFVLRNRRLSEVRVDVTFPTLARRFDGTWQRIPSQLQDSMGVAVVEPDESYRIGVHSGGFDEYSEIDTLFSKPYGAGEYAVSVYCRKPGRYAVARFDVGGAAKIVGPPSDVPTERSGATVTVYSDEPPDRETNLRLTFSHRSDADDPFQIAPEVLSGRSELRAAAFLRESGVDTVVVETDVTNFRTPVQWLEAAGVWQGSDAVYAIDDLAFTIEQMHDR